MDLGQCSILAAHMHERGLRGQGQRLRSRGFTAWCWHLAGSQHGQLEMGCKNMIRGHWISAWWSWNCQWMCMLTAAVHERLKWWIDTIPILRNTLMFWTCLLPPISPPWLVRNGPSPLLPTTGQSTRNTDLQHPRPQASYSHPTQRSLAYRIINKLQGPCHYSCGSLPAII